MTPLEPIKFVEESAIITAYRQATGMSRKINDRFFGIAVIEGATTFLYDYLVVPAEFRWIEWNREHATKHGCAIEDIESVVRNAGRGFPRKRDRKKWIVIGRETGGRMIEVVYLLDGDGTAFVIHAMPLTTRRRRG